MRLESIKQYWQEVCELTADLPNEEFSTPEVVNYVNKYLPSGYEPMTKTKVNYLRVQEILKPQGDGDIRTSWRYARDDIRRALVVELLKARANLGVKEIKGWLKSFEEAEAHGVLISQEENVTVLERPDLPDRISLAYTLLLNRVLGTLITTLSDGKAEITPPGCFIAIRTLEREREGESYRPDKESEPDWDEVEQLLKANTWLLAFTEPHSGKLYMYSDLEQLKKNRLELDENLEEYIWYNIILRGAEAQLYNVVIGLPDTDTPATIAIDKKLASQMEKDSPFDLIHYPGLSTLLKSALVDRSGMNEGTILSVLTEIIIKASDVWDYCAILVPEQSSHDGTEKLLYVQEHSSKSPRYLKDRKVEIGQFLPGWCYRYRQNFVVESTVENDPRIPFYDESHPVAAAAVPAMTEEQQSVGVVYVARNQRAEEEQPIFSEEALASLKAFGYICGDIIARDKVEIGTVRSLAQLCSCPTASSIPFQDLKGLLWRVIEEVQKGISPVNALHGWIYLLTLNIQIPSQGPLTDWLCQQVINVTSNFLAHFLSNLPHHNLLPIGQCQVGPNQYVFAILHVVDLPEEKYKEASLGLQEELSHMQIGGLATDFYSWALTFRCKDLSSQLNKKESLLEDMVDRTLGALVAGPYIKRGHEALHRHDLDHAVSEFEDALRVLRYAPNSWYVYKHLAEARMLQGTERGLDQAIEMSRKALKLNWAYASAHCLLADCLSYKGEFCEALIEYERALRLDSTRPDFLTRYGLALAGMTLAEYQKALEALKQQESELGCRSYYDAPREEAIDKFDKAQKLSDMYNNSPEEQRKNRADYHYQRGYAYLQAAQLDEAVENFAVGRKLAPENLQLAQAYSYALSLRRKEQRARLSI
jgi:tetratricopeptide (TPR) repeat protein